MLVGAGSEVFVGATVDVGSAVEFRQEVVVRLLIDDVDGPLVDEG